MRALLVLALLAGGCSLVDPTLRPGTLMVDTAPTENAAAMAVDPYDMIHGRGSVGSDGALAAGAVDRARADAVKPLLSGSGGMTPSATSSGGAQ